MQHKLWSLLVALGAVSLIAFASCDEDNEQNGSGDTDVDGDTDTDTDIDTDTDSDTDTDTDTDTDVKEWPEDKRGDPCEEFDPDDGNYNYGSSYAKGPYGFKSSLCWKNDGTEYYWSGGGDTMHDFCLPNQDGEQVCMHDFYRSEYDLLILDFSAMWCPPCRIQAQQATKFVDDLKEAGWNPAYITVLAQDNDSYPAEQADAAEWKAYFDLQEDVLYDTPSEWIDLSLIDRWQSDPYYGQAVFPWTFFVHTAHMRVWDLMYGFPDAVQYDQWLEQELELLNYCGTESGVLSE